MAQTVLLVDRDALLIDQTRQELLGAGFRVLCARDSAEAERILASTRPDVVVTEIILERPDAGFCLAWSIKKKDPTIPVLIVSSVTWHTGLYFGLSTPEDRAWIRADMLLDKPIRGEEMEAVIRRLLATSKAASA